MCFVERWPTPGSKHPYEENGGGAAWGTVRVSAAFTAVGTLLQHTRDCLVHLEPGNRPTTLQLREDSRGSFFLQGLTQIECGSSEVLLKTFEGGLSSSYARGAPNSEPRSHRLFTVAVQRVDGNGVEHSSTFHMLDLAGHERPAPAVKSTPGQKKPAPRTKASGNAEDITLKALGRVVSALADSRSHIPYRDSKLTRIVKEGFGGRAAGYCVLCVRAEDSAYDETTAMLTFMKQVQAISNRPTCNAFDRRAVLQEHQAKRTALAAKLGIAHPESMQSSEIQLGMDSPMELVELRDVIAGIERLDVK